MHGEKDTHHRRQAPLNFCSRNTTAQDKLKLRPNETREKSEESTRRETTNLLATTEAT